MKSHDIQADAAGHRPAANAARPDAVQAFRGEAATDAGTLQAAIDRSPRMHVQRRAIDALFGPAAGHAAGPPASGAGPLAAAPANRTGMPDQLKAGIESLSGMDLSDVRVHRNSDKPAQLNALAFAQGNDIHLGAGQEQHLPHEAWHVVQQRQGRVRETAQVAGTAINDDARLESEADSMGLAALRRGGRAGDGDPLRAPSPEPTGTAQLRSFTEVEIAEYFANDNKPEDSILQDSLEQDADIVRLGVHFYAVATIIQSAAGGNVRIADGQTLSHYSADIQQQVTEEQWAQIQPRILLAPVGVDNIGVGDLGALGDIVAPGLAIPLELPINLAGVYAPVVNTLATSIQTFNQDLAAFIADTTQEDLFQTARDALGNVDEAVGVMRNRVGQLAHDNPQWAVGEFTLWDRFREQVARYEEVYKLNSNDFWGEVYGYFNPA
jgi:hypothetical protein